MLVSNSTHNTQDDDDTHRPRAATADTCADSCADSCAASACASAYGANDGARGCGADDCGAANDSPAVAASGCTIADCAADCVAADGSAADDSPADAATNGTTAIHHCRRINDTRNSRRRSSVSGAARRGDGAGVRAGAG